MTNLSIKNYKKPPPRWFRLTKKVLSLTLNTVITALLILGYTNDSLVLLFIKLGESYVMNLLDTLLSNGEIYAEETPVYSAPKDNSV